MNWERKYWSEVYLRREELADTEKFLEIIIDRAAWEPHFIDNLQPDCAQRFVIPFGASWEGGADDTIENALSERSKQCIERVVSRVGEGRVAVLLWAGCGETDAIFAEACQIITDLQAEPMLLCYEKNPVSIGRFRRMQVIRYMISREETDVASMSFNEFESVYAFGVSEKRAKTIVRSGAAFMQSGTGPLESATYPWPNHENGSGEKIRILSSRAGQEEIDLCCGQLIQIDWGEEWRTIRNVLQQRDTDLLGELDDEDTALPSFLFSEKDLRYLKKY